MVKVYVSANKSFVKKLSANDFTESGSRRHTFDIWNG